VTTGKNQKYLRLHKDDVGLVVKREKKENYGLIVAEAFSFFENLFFG
jgi:hypothetical protein